MSNKIESAIGKLVNLDLAAKRESEFNIKNPRKEIELLAKKRAKICKLCEFNEVDPLESERVIDENIPHLSNKMCGKCFWGLP